MVARLNLPVTQTNTGPVTFRTGQPRQGRMLGQLTPADANAVSIYSPVEGVICEATHMIVTNVSGGAAEFTIYHDEAGTSYTNATTLVPGMTLNAKEYRRVELNAHMINPNGSMAVKTSVASAVTFTLYGLETQKRAR